MKIKYLFLFPISLLTTIFVLSSCSLIIPASSQAGQETPEPVTETMAATESTAVVEPTSDDIGDKIIIIKPLPGEIITSPLIVEGEARGFWFFEADFPVKLLDENKEVVAVHYATAQSDWMTEDFVPFRSEFEFSKPESKTGYLVLEKDNPSGLAEHDDSITIEILFE